MANEKEYTDFLKRELLIRDRLLHFKQQQVASLMEITKGVNQNMPPEAMFRLFENVLISQVGINKMMMFVNEDTWHIRCSLNCTEGEMSTSVEKLLSIEYTTNLQLSPSITFSGFDYIFPVFNKKRPLAFLLIGNMNDYENHDKEDKLKFIQTLANTVAVANENRRLTNENIKQQLIQKDMLLAAEIQKMLISSDLPKNEHINAAGIYKPQHDIGGDYYDLIRLNENEYSICIADISGKGVSAAMLMSNFQATMRILVNDYTSLAELIEQLNEKVFEIAHGEKYITFFIAHYNAATRRLKYLNAGHQHPLLINGGKSQWLNTGSMFLGVFVPLPQISSGELILEPASLLVTFTDGLVDVTNQDGKMYDSEMLKPFCEANAHNTPDELNKKLLDEVDHFRGLQDTLDDVSILTVRFH